LDIEFYCFLVEVEDKVKVKDKIEAEVKFKNSEPKKSPSK
jgi:hypothetical protein